MEAHLSAHPDIPPPGGDQRGIVHVEAITKKFAGPVRGAEVVALDHVHLDVRRGEFVALLGPSGCGKTTLLRILGGLEVPTSGRVFIDGQEMTEVPPERRPVNMVFQSPALFPHRSVFENIAFGPRMAGASAADIAPRVREMLGLVRLEGYEQRRVTQLSGGQAQRIALARALINRPKVLLLDEPLSALDLKLRKAMQLELKRIHRLLGTTFIYVTHDQEEAIVMADRIVIMNHGHIVQDGAPAEIYRKPASVFAADFIGESNLLPATVAERNSHGLVADLGGLQLRASGDPPVQPGQSIWISIRPEKIGLEAAGISANASTAEAATSGPNRFPGEITDVIFLGPLVRYEVQLQGGQRVMAIENYREDRATFQPGAAVSVVLPREHCLALVE
jgi:spermidine/putrescine ABC transporter ATP-binding subunit